MLHIITLDNKIWNEKTGKKQKKKKIEKNLPASRKQWKYQRDYQIYDLFFFFCLLLCLFIYYIVYYNLNVNFFTLFIWYRIRSFGCYGYICDLKRFCSWLIHPQNPHFTWKSIFFFFLTVSSHREIMASFNILFWFFFL